MFAEQAAGESRHWFVRRLSLRLALELSQASFTEAGVWVSGSALSDADLSDASPRYSQDWHRSRQLVSCNMQPSIRLAEGVLFTLNGQPRCLNAQQSLV